uniref:Polyene polyketide synthase 1 n=1 Tax=Agaricomycetes sp. TaxID=1709932 RepID=A0A220DGP5_9AGAM|nr:polyene polyketide synthase 1 [Agaricomycetes sp.]
MSSTAVPSYSNPDPRAIAVVGLSISAPGGEARGLDNDAFYEFLKTRGSGIINVPADRWNAEAYHGTVPGKICTTKGGFIPEFSYGDLQEFGITPAEGAQVATSQLVLLHQAFNALQRSGVDYRATNTGVYVGCANAGPSEMDPTQAGAYYMTGTSVSITANRINYVFDLLGPSLPVDTACSSSLTAMHLAIQAIRNGECEQAVVAGVNYIATPLETSAFSQLGVLSPDGISKSFDDSANGYARGDVASAVVIKRHDLAVRDMDCIHATIVGSALTSCGSLMGSLTTPSPEAQSQAIKNAYKDAGLKPCQADFVELHGTGTIVGDQTETNAAGALFADGRDGREILIGSVKSNIGHGEMGAYMSSLVKVVMMLDRHQVLPNGYFKTPSRKIEFTKYNLRVPTDVEGFVPYDKGQGLIASISSYGFGGSCGHTVLRGHEPRPILADSATLKNGPFLFAVGALSPKACNSLVQSYKDEYSSMDSLALSAHLGNRARQMPWRTYAVADSFATATFPDPTMVGKRSNPLIFCFSGQGPQHWQQGRDLMVAFSVFRETIYACDKVHHEYTGRSFLEKTGLFVKDAPKTSPLKDLKLTWPADVISVAITFFQVALFDLLISLGIRPDAVVGHSIGETAVLYASGAMPRDMVVKIAIARGRALAKVDNVGGAMVAVSGCDAATVKDYVDAASSLAELDEEESKKLYLAAFNSPTDIGVSGSEKLVDILTKHIETWVDGVMARKLRVSTAVHSPYVDPCEEGYRSELAEIFKQYEGRSFVPSTLTMSTVIGEFVSEGYSVDYLWNNLRKPVLFSTAIPKIMEKFGEETTFVEIAPHPVLSQYTKQMGAFDSLAGSQRPPSARHLKPGVKPSTEVHTLLQTLGRLLVCGINSINFTLLSGCPPAIFDGPKYPFQMKFWPFAPRAQPYLRRLLPAERPLNSTRLRISPGLPEPWMGHHIIDHANIVPAAAYIEMALEFPGVTQVWDVRFEAAYTLDESSPPGTLEVSRDGHSWSVKSSSALLTMQGDLEWTRAAPEFDTVHAYGKIGYGKPEISRGGFEKIDVDAVLARCFQSHEKDELYTGLEGIAQFGSEFVRVEKASLNETEAICWIRGHVGGLNATDYHFHPALMDATFQSSFAFDRLGDKIDVAGKERAFLLPYSLRRGYRNDGNTEPLVLPELFRTYSVLQSWSYSHWTMDIYILAEDNSVLFTFEGLHFALVVQDKQWPKERYTTYWQPHALPATEFEGAVLLPGPTEGSEVEYVLRKLDLLALNYSSKTLKSLPPDFLSNIPDRKRYISWARQQTKKFESSMVSEFDISPVLREKYGSLFELTERVGSGQKDIMISSTAAVELLFRDDIMSKIYEYPPFVGLVFEKAVSSFIDLVKRSVASGKRVVRVLEVGAGTGRFTALLGQAMLDAELDKVCYVDYVSTDISISLAQESTAKSPWLTITPLAFDLTIPIEQQNLDPASFDIIVAFDVLHATSSISTTLSTLHDLLLPGGHLAVIELDGGSFANGAVGTIWMDYIFGSFAEWMGVLEARPGATHCSLTPSEWKSELAAAGYADTLLITSSGPVISHMAFISQAQDYSSPSQTPPLTSSVSSPSPRSEIFTPHGEEGAAQVLTTDDSSAFIDALAHQKVVGGKLFALPTKTDVVEVSRISPLIEQSPSDALTVVRRFDAAGEIDLVHFLSDLDANKPYVFWLYTDTEDANMTLVGIVRSVRHEFGLWKLNLVLFHPSWSLSQQEAFVYGRLMSLKWVDAEVMVDEKGVIRVARVVTSLAPPTVEPRGNHPVQFDSTHIWRAFPSDMGGEDVEVSVSFLNISPAFPGCAEFSGVVSAVGSPSEEGLVGKRIFGVASSKAGSVVVCKRSLVAPIPEDMHASTAAAIVGRLSFVSSVVSKTLASAASKTPRVLVHAGSASPAAIATFIYLRARSLDVMVTATDPSLPGIDTHVYNSNNCDIWSFQVREWATKGVDIILNFDTDARVAKESIGLLSNRGILVQVGGDLPPRLRRGQQYISVDYAGLLEDEEMVESAIDFFSSALVPALKSFKLQHFAAAYEKAQERTSYGYAVLVDMRNPDPKLSVTRGGVIRGTSAFDPRAAYVIVGGIGGLGASIARCLVENGARHIVLTSRSGAASFRPGHLMREKKILNSLRETHGVTIDLEAVDCLDTEKTKALFSHSPRRVAGVFYVAVRLNDQLFTNLRTEEDWKTVYDVKVKGLHVLLQAINPEALDFLVLTSSMATVTGSPGQANYSAAQTEMESIGARLPNTVSVTVPPITDGGIFVRSMPPGNARNAALDKYKSLGMTGMRLAEHCVDAIWTLNTPAFNPIYIPPMNWSKVAELGIPDYLQSSFRHLHVKESASVSAVSASNEQTIRAACAMVLSLPVEDVEENIPLSSYGLDSLTSVRLSGILKQYFDITVTQLQLLSAHTTVSKLQTMQEEQRLATSAAADSSSMSSRSNDATDSSTTLKTDMDKTVIPLNTVSTGRPVFIIHGAGGGVLVMQKMAQKVRFPVYGVQDTPDAPITGTLETLSKFYLEKIKEVQSEGPYRLGGFSFGTNVALAIARMLKTEGETVETLLMLDGSPALFRLPLFVEYTKNRIVEGTIRDDIMDVINDMSTSGTLDNAEEVSQQFSDHFQKTTTGGSGPKWIARFCKAYVAHILMGIRASKESLKLRRSGTQTTQPWPAARTVLVRASNGLATATTALGVSQALDMDVWVPDVQLHELEGSHFGILSPDSGLSGILNEVFAV